MDFLQRKNAFIQLGNALKNLGKEERQELIYRVAASNLWFTEENVKFALNGIIHLLTETDLEKWLANYKFPTNNIPKKVGLIMAGNIPAVGFHDLMCVLLSGNELHAKLSKDDSVFPKLLMQYLIEIEPAFKPFIHYQESMKKIDALISTGSDNSARYFEYYFSKIPRIIRKNRTSMGILTGEESTEDLKLLGRDIFTYFGMGCRNISKIFVPSGYDFAKLFESVFDYGHVINSNKYCNNYEYNRAIYLMNKDKFLDNNFLIIKESEDLVSPIGVLFFQYYSNMDEVLDYIIKYQEKLQCIACQSPKGREVKFGEAQMPAVWDYADNVDTLAFLIRIS